MFAPRYRCPAQPYSVRGEHCCSLIADRTHTDTRKTGVLATYCCVPHWCYYKSEVKKQNSVPPQANRFFIIIKERSSRGE
jgi:hypothetical protein